MLGTASGWGPPDFTSLECIPTRHSHSCFHLCLIYSHLLLAVECPRAPKPAKASRQFMFISVSSLLILRNKDWPCLPFSAQLSLPGPGLLLCYFSPLTSCNLHPVISNISFVSSLCYRFPICFPSFYSRQRNPSHPCLISLDLFTFHLVCLLHQSKGPGLLLLKMLSWLAARIPLFCLPADSLVYSQTIHFTAASIHWECIMCPVLAVWHLSKI